MPRTRSTRKSVGSVVSEEDLNPPGSSTAIRAKSPLSSDSDYTPMQEQSSSRKRRSSATLSDDDPSTERRRKQNRNAQRKFRAKQGQQVTDLKEELSQLKEQHEEAKSKLATQTALIGELRTENETLRRQSVSSIASSPTLHTPAVHSDVPLPRFTSPVQRSPTMPYYPTQALPFNMYMPENYLPPPPQLSVHTQMAPYAHYEIQRYPIPNGMPQPFASEQQFHNSHAKQSSTSPSSAYRIPNVYYPHGDRAR